MVADSHFAGRTNAVPIAEEFEDDSSSPDDAAPPAYGDFHDQLQLSQAGFEAGAAVTADGRVSINLNQKDRRLSDLLAPTLRRQLIPEQPPSRLSTGPLPPAYIPPSLGGQPGQTPPPRLNVVIQIVGSRGDVQPFVALGQVLRDTYGHRVRVATHPTFQGFVEENGLEFFSIGGDPAELMAFMVKNPGLMPGLDALKSGEIKKRREGIKAMLMGCWRSCIEAGDGLGPPVMPQRVGGGEATEEVWDAASAGGRPFVADAIIANPPSFAHIHVAEKLGIPLHMMFTMPWSPTRAFPHPLASIESSNTDVVMQNYMSYALVEMLTWQGLGDVINRFREKTLGLQPLSLIWAPGLLNRLRVPTTYCWSPALIPKPNDWGQEVTIAGFYFLNLASSYTPDPELAAFLAAGPPPVYIGFGSIVVDNPNFLTRTIFDAVSMSGVRALVSKGWGGLGADAVGIPDNVFMLGNVPHDWLFQHVSAVVHHGGAGTSAAGIKAGKPTVVVPFFGDQPFWGQMIAKAGAGPAPIPFKKLSVESLATAIGDALKPETQARAMVLGARISDEQGADVGGKAFHQFLGLENMRCSLAPSRVAIWRVRRTKTRLSALAAAVLVREGELKYKDLKLYRPTEYNTDDAPWEPISAVTSCLVGDISTIAMAVADFPKEIFEKRAGSRSNESTADLGTSDEASRSGAQLEQQTSLTSSRSTTAPSLVIPEQKLPSASQTSLASSRRTPVGSPYSSLRNLSPLSPGLHGRPASRGEASSPALGSNLNLDTALNASENVSRIVETGIKMPMNFCMGLARGFRNAPKLYNDDTVRPAEKVTGLASGLKVAGKEFGLGIYDGITGLVTQPYKGAEKDGGAGLVKGFGKGIGGFFLKPAAAIWSIPAYAMQGVHAEVKNMLAKSSMGYVIASRIRQGDEELAESTIEEQKDVLARWNRVGEELKGFYDLKSKEKEIGDRGDGTTDTPSSAPKTGWFHTRNLSFEERKRLHTEKLAWRKQQRTDRSIPRSSGSGDSANGAVTAEDEEFERAILASVQQTSRGDSEEDARVEAAIRASVREMRRIAEEQSRERRGPVPQDVYSPEKVQIPVPERDGALVAELDGSTVDDDLRNITDEEYQALIEEAVKLSLTEQQQHLQRQAERHDQVDEDDDAELLKAIELSRAESFRKAPPQEEGVAGDDDVELRRALEESERAHRQELRRQMTEEEIIMEYVKKQSLAEEEYRKAKGKGKATNERNEESPEFLEDLDRAVRESLIAPKGRPRGGSAGPS
ncbi:hypothetical protein OQA88_1560 [Cercophora sp. LCS_1]